MPLTTRARAMLATWQDQPPTVVVIAPVGRSGSLFLHSLFDSHPEVLTLPAWLTADYDEELPLPPRASRARIEALAHRFADANAAVFDGRRSFYADTQLLSRGGMLGDAGDRLYEIPRARFVAAVADLLADRARVVDGRAFALAVHLAVWLALDRDPGGATTIVWHNHLQLPATYAGLARDFPDVRYLFTTRDPRESVLAFRQLERELAGHEHVFSECAMHLRIHADQALRAHRAASTSTPARVRYADLNRMHRAQEGAMRELAAWAGIGFHPSLLTSTVLGLAWHGNATDRSKRSGFDAARARYRWPEQLEPQVARLIEHLFFHYMRAMRFDVDERPSRARALATLWLHDPVPALFPVATFTNTPGRIVDAALSDDARSFSPRWSRTVPLPLLRVERAARNLYRFWRDENERRWQLFLARYRPAGRAVFEELERVFAGAHVDDAQLVGL